MHRYRVNWIVLAALAFPGTVESQQDRSTIHSRVTQARQSLAAAASTGNWSAIESLLAEDVVLAVRSERIAGRAAVMARLQSLVPGAQRGDIQLYPDSVSIDDCVDGVYERAGEYRVSATAGERSWRNDGRYSLRWVVREDGRAVVQSMGLVALSERFGPRLSPCRVTYRRDFATRRLLIGLGFGLGNWETFADLDGARRARGWGVGDLPEMLGHPGSHESPRPLLAGIRYRRAFLSVELVASPLERDIVVTGCCNNSTHITTSFSGRQLGALVAVERYNLRLGAGLMAVRGTWTSREECLTPDGSGGFTSCGINQLTIRDETLTAPVISAAWVLPVASRMFFELRVMATGSMNTQTDSLPQYPPVPVNQRIRMGHIGIGMAL